MIYDEHKELYVSQHLELFAELPADMLHSDAALRLCLLQCVRIHTDGRMATVYLKRRDLLRLFALDPRDLRCIDPNLHYTRLSPSLYVRGNVILAQLAGVRLIITGNTALLLDPHSSAAKKLLGQLVPKLQARLPSLSSSL